MSIYRHQLIYTLATGWIEICAVPDARVELVANQVGLAWLTRYLLPNKVNVDRDEELMARFKTLILNVNAIPCNFFSSRHPQANAIVERGNQTLDNMICTFIIQDLDI